MTAVVVTRLNRSSVEPVLKALAVALCYYVAGRLGLLGRLVVEGVVVTPIWPPTGVAVVALLVFGLRVWPGIALGSFLVIASLTTPRLTTLVTVLGSVAAPFCAVLLLRRARFRLDIARLRDGLALVLGGLAAMLIAPTVGAGMQLLTGDLETGEFWAVWLAWWVGDAMGVLLVTPLLLVAVGAVGRLRRAGWTELVCLVLATVVLVPVAALSRLSMLYIVFPLLIWAALRFQLAGSMLCALFASVLTSFEANAGRGAFEQLSAVEIMVKLQAFNGAAALTALLLSAMVSEAHATRHSVENACNELAEVLEHLAAGGPPPEPSTSHAVDTEADGPPRR
ncbi:MASE1 domain-containing protein [Streptomyces sp. NPDC006552]|uniref:MASE1 domain-containing protein n=1 Tax=Streptomyces sp. NPDC006552 TaxID=3157179 RepID=UPI0033B2E94B